MKSVYLEGDAFEMIKGLYLGVYADECSEADGRQFFKVKIKSSKTAKTLFEFNIYEEQILMKQIITALWKVESLERIIKLARYLQKELFKVE